MNVLLLLCPERVGSQWVKRMLATWGYLVITHRENIPIRNAGNDVGPACCNLRAELFTASGPVLVGDASHRIGEHDIDALMSVVREFDRQPKALVLFRDGYSQAASQVACGMQETGNAALEKIRDDYANIFSGLKRHGVRSITVSYEWLCADPATSLANTLLSLGCHVPKDRSGTEPAENGNLKYK